MTLEKVLGTEKTVFEWLILIISTICAIFIGITGLTFLLSGDIFGQVGGTLFILLFAGVLILVYKFYKDDPWGWYGLYLFQAFILLLAILASYSELLLNFLGDFYLKVIKGITNVIITFFGGETYDVGMLLMDTTLAGDSFLNTYSIFIGGIIALLGAYWSIRVLTVELSDTESQSLKKQSAILLILMVIMTILGIFLFFINGSLNTFIGFIIGALGISLVLILLRIQISTEQRLWLLRILMVVVLVVIAIFSFDIIIAALILISAVGVFSLRYQSIRDKFEPLWTPEQREERTALTLILPTVSIVILIVLIPVIWVVISSFFDIGLANLGPNARPADFVFIQNYVKFLVDDEFYVAVITTILFTIIGTVSSVGLGLLAAILINYKFPARGVVRTIYLFPYIASTVAMVFLWQWAFDPVYGVFNYLLYSFGFIDSYQPWLSQQPFAFIILVIFQAWKYFPFAMLMFLAQLQAIPQDIYEAADIDGANSLQKFWHITLPELKYVIGVVTLLRVIWTFNKFDDVYLFTKGSIETGTHTLPIYIFDKIWTGIQFSISEATAVALIVVIGLIIFSVLFGRRVLKW
ncbi:MAG: carbohydrate ABC transporter permease [Promethearchaeota archaeon]